MPKGGKNKNNASNNNNANDDNRKEGLMAHCVCGTVMQPVVASTVYEKYMPLFCNECWAHVPSDIIVYSCPKRRCWDHLAGYDICKKCADKHDQQYQREQQQQQQQQQNSNESENNNSDHNNNSGVKNKFKSVFSGAAKRSKKLSQTDSNSNIIDNHHHRNMNMNMNLNLHLSPTLIAILTQNIMMQNMNNHNDGSKDGIENENENESENNNNNLNMVNEQALRVSHLSIVDEISRLSALQISTLGQISHIYKSQSQFSAQVVQESKHKHMYSLTDLHSMTTKLHALQQLQQKLNNRMYLNVIETFDGIADTLLNWKQWTSAELSEWIMLLENGKFYKKYAVEITDDDENQTTPRTKTTTINLIEKAILTQNICGKHLALNEEQKNLLIQSIGIQDFDDRLLILKNIQLLVKGEFRFQKLNAIFIENQKHEQQNVQNMEQKHNHNQNVGESGLLLLEEQEEEQQVIDHDGNDVDDEKAENENMIPGQEPQPEPQQQSVDADLV